MRLWKIFVTGQTYEYNVAGSPSQIIVSKRYIFKNVLSLIHLNSKHLHVIYVTIILTNTILITNVSDRSTVRRTGRVRVAPDTYGT